MNTLNTDSLFEPGRSIPVAGEYDLCVVGGSCTGVFAAVRAARLGLRVAVLEQNTILGGMATAAQVNEWHSVTDVFHEQPIIGGLTMELIERLKLRDVVRELPKKQRTQFRFNPAEMAYELDLLAHENRVQVYLGARFAAPVVEIINAKRRVTAVFIEDKSGRRAIRARYFIDASGDGDLVRRAQFKVEKGHALQPVNLQAMVYGLEDLLRTHSGRDIWESVQPLLKEYDYPAANGSPWFFECPGAPALTNIFGPRHHGVDASNADELSEAYRRGRHFQQALLAMLRRTYNVQPVVVAWPHALGVRETWHACCQHRLTGEELLRGESFPDAIANGTYPVDIHHPDGTRLTYLDGRAETVFKDGRREWSRWRAEEESPRCYHIPYRSLVPLDSENVLVAGRIYDADREAFGATRVMVNMNQTGEAAGAAAALASVAGTSVDAVDPMRLREALAQGGSIVLEPCRV